MNISSKLNKYLEALFPSDKPIALEEYLKCLKQVGFTKEGAIIHLEHLAKRDGVENIYWIANFVRIRWSSIKIKNTRSLMCQGTRHTKEEWEEKKKQYDYKCIYCGKKPNKLTKDHVIPISRGGKNNIENIVPACWNCNYQKRATAVEYFKEGVTLKLL